MERDEYQRMYELEETHWWFAGKRRIASTLLAPHLGEPARQRILDVGCGTGGMLRFLLGSYGRAYGVDLSADALAYCRLRGLDLTCRSSIGSLPFPADAFDLVTAFDVLYHQWVGDDLAALRECARVLRPGGFILVTDSAFQFLWSEHDVRYRGRHRYTTGELTDRLGQAGLAVIRQSYVNTTFFPIVAALRLLGRLRPAGGVGPTDLYPLPAWLNGLLGSIYSIEARGLTWFSYPVGVSVVCLAQKRAVAGLRN